MLAPKIKLFAVFSSLVIPAFFLYADAASALTVSPPRLEVSADPGQTIEQEFRVVNEERESKTLYLIPQNFEAKDESGEPNFIPGRQNLAGWIKSPESITLGPGEDRVVKFFINIPVSAEVGGYFTALFLQDNPPTFEQGTGVSVGSQLGTLVLLRVNGQISDEAGILEFSTKNKKRWFNSLPIEFYYRFQNTGIDRVRPLGDVVISNIFGMNSKLLSANHQKGNVLPKSIRKFETAWISSGGGQEVGGLEVETPELQDFWDTVQYQWSHFAVGFYKARLQIAYGTPAQGASSTFSFFVFPWQLLVVSFVTLVIVTILLRVFIKRYNFWIINKAVPQGGKPVRRIKK